MTVLLGSVLLASLIGNLHCAGMCGPFALLVAGGSGPSAWQSQCAYHLGRLLTYATLGAAAGAMGQLLDLGGSWAGVQRAAALLAGAAMIAFAATTALPLLGVRMHRFAPPEWLRRLTVVGHERAVQLSPRLRGLVIGLLTTLLPCGWLYAFVLAAGGSGSPLLGLLTMAAFWVGTLPALVLIGAAAQRLAGRLGRAAPALVSLSLLAVGLLTLAGRLSLPDDLWTRVAQARAGSTMPPASANEVPCCHDER